MVSAFVLLAMKLEVLMKIYRATQSVYNLTNVEEVIIFVTTNDYGYFLTSDNSWCVSPQDLEENITILEEYNVDDVNSFLLGMLSGQKPKFEQGKVDILYRNECIDDFFSSSLASMHIEFK